MNYLDLKKFPPMPPEAKGTLCDGCMFNIGFIPKTSEDSVIQVSCAVTNKVVDIPTVDCPDSTLW